MAPIDGAIGMKININHPQTTDVNISKAQPSKASGLGGVRFLRSKSAPILYKYRLYKKDIREAHRANIQQKSKPNTFSLFGCYFVLDSIG